MWDEDCYSSGVDWRSRRRSSSQDSLTSDGEYWTYHLPEYEQSRQRSHQVQERAGERSYQKDHSARSHSPPSRRHADRSRSPRRRGYLVGGTHGTDVMLPADRAPPNSDDKRARHGGESSKQPAHCKTPNSSDEKSQVQPAHHVATDQRDEPSHCHEFAIQTDKRMKRSRSSDRNEWSPRDQKTIHLCQGKHSMLADVSSGETDQSDDTGEEDDYYDPNLYCELCGIVVTSADQMQSHYDGQKHRKTLRRIERGEPAIPQPQPKNPSRKKPDGLEIDPNALTLVKCAVCKAELFSNELGPHIDSNDHKEAEEYWLRRGMELPSVRDMFVKQFQLGDADSQVQPSDSIDTIFVCTVCDVSLGSLEAERVHLGGKKHLRKVKQLEREKDPLRYHCGFCNIFCNSSKELNIHQKGKKHITRASWKAPIESTVPPSIGKYTTTTSEWQNSY